jgi:phosphonate transport system substrate-binding protein
MGLALCATYAGAADKPYQFGVFPYLPVTKIYDLYQPMAVDFGAKLGRQVQLMSKPQYKAFGDELRREVYDIAFVQPFDYVDAHDNHGYLPLARQSGNLHALIVVRDDSPVKSLKDLRGKTIGNPPVDAAVSHLTSMALRHADIDPNAEVRREYGKNHSTCLHRVVIGAADACGLAESPYRTLEQTLAPARLRVLHKTAGIPRALLVVHRRVPKRDREALLKTIVEWPNTEEGKKILAGGQFIPFVAAKDADYRVIRRYNRSRK